jgi:hypothetical protein
MVRYTKAGKYVAICNTGNFDGHYTKVFDYPQSFINEWNKTQRISAPDAAWYFLNRIDFVACIEAVYPIEIFEDLKLNTTWLLPASRGLNTH